MPVPKRKRSRSRRDKRFANKGVKVCAFSSCSNCSEPILSHVVCKTCGFYKGRKVLNTKSERSVKRADVRTEKQTKQEALRKKLENSDDKEQA